MATEVGTAVLVKKRKIFYVIVTDESRDMARLIADVDTLLELDLTAEVKADLSQVSSEINAEGVTKSMRRDAVLKLLAAIAAEF